MYGLGRLLQLAGLITVGAGALVAFWREVGESTMWMLWGGGLLIFYAGRALSRRAD